MFKRKPPTQSLRSVNDVESQVRVALAQKGKLSLRESVPILVIDDQPFEPAVNLRNNHYQIHTRLDLNRVEEARDFPIVLCDLQGVGSQLHVEMQGAHLIREIKTHYPEKIVIAYSGIAKNVGMARTAQQYADSFLRKDENIDSWIELLDESIAKVSDPIYMWKSFRKRILDSGMTPMELAQLEDAFVNSLWDGRQDVERSVQTRIGSIGLQNDLRAVVTGCVSSLIFKALVG
jgi:hypothetical protein